MIINLSRINICKEMTIPFEFSIPFENETLFKNYNIVRSKEIHVVGKASLVDNEIIMQFKYDGTLVLKCDRCLELFDFALENDVFKEIKPGTQSDMESQENDIYYYEGDEIDISKIVMDDIFLNLPIQMVCKPDCRGLCTTCGVNLNETDCDCNKGNIDPRFEVLKGFFDKEEV